MPQWECGKDQLSSAASVRSLVAPFGDVRGIYFDLDDTLCGYWDASKAGLRATFEACPVPHTSSDEMINHWAAAFREFCPSLKRTAWYSLYLKDSGTTRTELMRLTLEKAGVLDTELAALLSATYMRERDSKLKLFPDATALLGQLNPDLKLGLITNGPADLQRMEIETLGLTAQFEHIFIEGELGVGKPEAEVFLKARLAMDLEPNEILFVGNSFEHDIRPAISNGWRTAWIRRESDVPPSAHGVVSKPEEHPAGAPMPDLIVNDLTELLN